jgi:hypothetical protein
MINKRVRFERLPNEAYVSVDRKELPAIQKIPWDNQILSDCLDGKPLGFFRGASHLLKLLIVQGGVIPG